MKTKKIAILTKGNRIMLIQQPTKRQMKKYNKRKWDVHAVSSEVPQELHDFVHMVLSFKETESEGSAG